MKQRTQATDQGVHILAAMEEPEVDSGKGEEQKATEVEDVEDVVDLELDRRNKPRPTGQVTTAGSTTHAVGRKTHGLKISTARVDQQAGVLCRHGKITKLLSFKALFLKQLHVSSSINALKSCGLCKVVHQNCDPNFGAPILQASPNHMNTSGKRN